MAPPRVFWGGLGKVIGDYIMNSFAVAAVTYDGGAAGGVGSPTSLSHVADVGPDVSNLDAAKVAVPPPGRVVVSDFARLSTFMAEGFAQGFTTKLKSQAIPMLQASARGESDMGDVVAWAYNVSEVTAITKNISSIAANLAASVKDLVMKA